MGVTIALLFLLETCFVQMQSVWVYFAYTLRLFNLSAEAIINARNARLYVRCAVVIFEDQSNSFFLAPGQGAYIFGENPKSIQDNTGDVLSWQVLFQQKEMQIYWYYVNVTTPRSIYDCGKCGAWLFVHKVPLSLQEHVKTTKTDKTRFFFAKKR